MLRFIFVMLALALAVFIYVQWIRPTIRNLPHIKEALDDADTFWQKVLAWARVQWDMLIGGALIVLPELPDLLQQLTSIDLSALIPSDMAKSVSALFGILALVARAFVLRKTS